MNIARQLAKYEAKGFTRERAQINVLMEAAAFAIFSDFPDAFLLLGGATLVLYHDSVRHSADLDLLSRGSEIPSREEIVASLERGLTPLGQAMGVGPLQFEIDKSSSEDGRIYVTTTGKERLFRVDLSNLGSAIESEIESHQISGEGGSSAVVKSPTKELLLLQKAEAFLLRRNVKARDAYDVRLLQGWARCLVPIFKLIWKILSSRTKSIQTRSRIESMTLIRGGVDWNSNRFCPRKSTLG